MLIGLRGVGECLQFVPTVPPLVAPAKSVIYAEYYSSNIRAVKRSNFYLNTFLLNAIGLLRYYGLVVFSIQFICGRKFKRSWCPFGDQIILVIMDFFLYSKANFQDNK